MIGYSTRVDSLIERLGHDLTTDDFRNLAMACLDQAGLSLPAQELVAAVMAGHDDRGIVVRVPPSLASLVVGALHSMATHCRADKAHDAEGARVLGQDADRLDDLAIEIERKGGV